MAAGETRTAGAPDRRHGIAHAPIRINLRSIQQLFNSLDPSPFRDRDLDPQAAQYIIEEAEDRTDDAKLTVVLHVPAVESSDPGLAESAIHNYFALLRQSRQRKIRSIFREGRWALAVGLVAVCTLFAGARFLGAAVPQGSLWHSLVDSMIVLGWVVLWRPAELLLYDWWPVRKQVRLYRRLERAEVRLVTD